MKTVILILFSFLLSSGGPAYSEEVSVHIISSRKILENVLISAIKNLDSFKKGGTIQRRGMESFVIQVPLTEARYLRRLGSDAGMVKESATIFFKEKNHITTVIIRCEYITNFGTSRQATGPINRPRTMKNIRDMLLRLKAMVENQARGGLLRR